MCYNIASLTKKAQHYEQRYKARFIDEPTLPLFHVKAFDHPDVPVITSREPEVIRLFTWGMIPFWCKDAKTAEKMRNITANARGDTIFEKPTFKNPALKQRCLVIVDGFYEFHHYNKKVYPFFIRLKNEESFALAGVWDRWNKIDGIDRYTFSIVTTEANPLMTKIHNKNPKDPRMPLILPREFERDWINEKLEQKEITDLIRSLDDENMMAHTVASITTRKENTNRPDIFNPVNYEELGF